MSWAGAACGYLLSTSFLSIYHDFIDVDVSTLDIDGPMDPRWVGAWWLLYVVGAVALYAIAVPLMAFSRQLPGAKRLYA
jgi:hypothetical protein